MTMAVPVTVQTAAGAVPGWLEVMRSVTGITETPGEADNAKIMAMADSIAAAYPEMESYCALYEHDATPWCGLAAAYCLAMTSIRPPFGPTDTDKFLWAFSFDETGVFGQLLTSPVLGCIVVLGRDGGGHVTFYESTEGSYYKCRGGNQSDAINTKNFPIDDVVALIWPREAGEPPPAPPRTLKLGDSGPDVAKLQTVLGIPADGDFGPVTESAVEGFQAGTGLAADGVCGPRTWVNVDILAARKTKGSDGLPVELKNSIVALAESSPLMNYSWDDRGRAPPGYVPGMALSFALALIWLAEGDRAAVVMAQADRRDAETDALSEYATEFDALGMSNLTSGPDTLRHLFVLLIGLGMRESSGKYFEGRDMTASNVEPDTAEAGLFQTSWNIATCDESMDALLDRYIADPNGFLEAFQKGIAPGADDLGNYGKGEGATYQWLAKYCPAFAVMTTGVGLRLRCGHWGPINRHEVELVREADILLSGVQGLLAHAPPPEPEPEPPIDGDIPVVTITVATQGDVRVDIVQQISPEPGSSRRTS